MQFSIFFYVNRALNCVFIVAANLTADTQMCHLRRLKSISAAWEKTEALQASEAPSPLKKINTKKTQQKTVSVLPQGGGNR